MLKKLNQFTDQFAPEGQILSVSQTTRFRVLNNSSVIAALFAWSYIGICWFIGYQIAVVSLAVSGVLFALIPYLIKKGASYSLMANYFIFIAFASNLLYIYTQSGIRFSVLSPWLVFPICMAMLFLGLRFALIWTLICSTAVTGFVLLDYYKVNMPIMYNYQEWELPYRWIAFNGLLFILLLVINIFKNSENAAKQKLEEINHELENTVNQLKETQAQLIQKEKLAAFGVMASRVSHEISNPLNFINNFSEINKELVNELINASSEEEKKESADTLLANLKIIYEHGNRAADIVKQLQQHSSKGTAKDFFEDTLNN